MTGHPCYVCGTRNLRMDTQEWVDHVLDHEPILMTAVLIVRDAERQGAH